MTPERYNDFLQKLHNLDINIDNDQLDILELFVQTGYLTITEITHIIRSTKLEKAYKNVHGNIQKLKSLNLIEETLLTKRGRHNEKPLKLRDEGIYLLFLKRPQGILIDQLSVRKGERPVSYIHNFLNFYGDNKLFKLFIYPYFEKQTISADNFHLVIELFNYLNECCKRLDLALRVQIPIMIPKFSWKNIPGQDELLLLSSLKDLFDLKDIKKDTVHMKKSACQSSINIIAPNWSILIELDIERGKAVATINDMNNNFRKFEYRIMKSRSEILVGTIQPPEDPIKMTLHSNRRFIEPRIYELVSNVGKSSDSIQDEPNSISLAQDDRFMTLLEDIHNNIHNNFERGYQQLMALRKRM